LAGTEWRARLLLESLSDRYDANRYLAFRAILKMPGFDGFQFDHIAPESERRLQVEDAKTRCNNLETESQQTRLKKLLGDRGSSSVDELVEMLKSKRAEVPMLIQE